MVRDGFIKRLVVIASSSMVLLACSNTGGPVNPVATNLENVLLLTDIHFDPFSSCGPSPTSAAQACVARLLVESSPAAWHFPVSGLNNYSQEMNNQFLLTALSGITAYITAQHIDKIFITGDMLSHSFPTQFVEYAPQASNADYTKFTARTINYILYQLKEATNGAKVYYVFGNNDTNKADYSFPSESFMQQVTSLIAPYMAESDSFSNTFSRGGYSAMAFNSQSVVLGLNFNPLTRENEFHPIDEEIAQQQFLWLAEQLAEIRKEHKKAIILQHEPFGINAYNIAESYSQIDNLVSELQQQYLDLYQEYRDVIQNYYYGHYHMDNLQSGAKIFAVGTLSLGVDFYNNPGFKILKLNPAGALQDYTTYFANFATQTLSWQPLYSLNQTYGITPESYLGFFESQLTPGNNLNWQSYTKYYSGGNISAGAESQIPILTASNWSNFYCVINNFTADSYYHCIESASS